VRPAASAIEANETAAAVILRDEERCGWGCVPVDGMGAGCGQVFCEFWRWQCVVDVGFARDCCSPNASGSLDI